VKSFYYSMIALTVAGLGFFALLAYLYDVLP
jgi:hypothetical protein